MMRNFEEVKKEFNNIYNNIFCVMYPALGSNGFTERNLTVNLSKAYERVNSNTITWFEFPFKLTYHLDGLLIDKDEKNIYLIESKRLSNPRKKKEIFKDIERINGFTKVEIFNPINNKRERIKNINDYKLFSVIILDVWYEEKWKKKFSDTGSLMIDDLSFKFEKLGSFLPNENGINTYSIFIRIAEIK